MILLFDSRNTEFKRPFGCVPLGAELCITVYVQPKNSEAFLLFRRDGEEEKWIPMNRMGSKKEYGIFTAAVSGLSAGLSFYRFCLRSGGKETIFGKGAFNEPEQNGQNAWQVLCYDPSSHAPQPFCGAVYYQIFPDRFYQEGTCDLSEKLTPYWIHENKSDVPQYQPDEHGEIKNNDFFGGNLRGIQAKLDDLDELGVRVLYLTPIFMAYSNHRYDTADYLRVDPMLGTEDDFRALCCKAHEKGMKIILDGVFSHTGDNSVYFDRYGHFGNGAVSNPDSPYRSWYRFTNYPHDYESWWGIRTLPCVEELNPSYLEYMITGPDSVIRHWLRLGADGYRLDVADELPDEFLELLRKAVKEEKEDAVIIGEVWEDASNKISYGKRRKYFYGAELDGVMNYVFRGAIIDFVTGVISAQQWMERVMQLVENYPAEALSCSLNLLSTHDTGRILTVLAGTDGNQMSRDERARAKLNAQQYEQGVKRLLAAVFLLFTLPGSPCIYYGDEIGMQGYEDPFNRRFYEWDSGDEAVREIFKRMAKVKNTSFALRVGGMEPCSVSDGFVSFYRRCNGESLLCAVNRSCRPVTLPVSCAGVLEGMRYLKNDKKITLLPFGSGVFQTG